MRDAAIELIDAIHDNVAMSQGISRRLDGIADALDRVGMQVLADEIAEIANAVLAGPKAVQGAHGGKLSADLRHSEEFTSSMLKAVLAGCIVPPKGKNPSGAGKHRNPS